MKKCLKKGLSILLTIAVFVSLTPAMAFAGTDNIAMFSKTAQDVTAHVSFFSGVRGAASNETYLGGGTIDHYYVTQLNNGSRKWMELEIEHPVTCSAIGVDNSQWSVIEKVIYGKDCSCENCVFEGVNGNHGAHFHVYSGPIVQTADVFGFLYYKNENKADIWQEIPSGNGMILLSDTCKNMVSGGKRVLLSSLETGAADISGVDLPNIEMNGKTYEYEYSSSTDPSALSAGTYTIDWNSSKTIVSEKKDGKECVELKTGENPNEHKAETHYHVDMAVVFSTQEAPAVSPLTVEYYDCTAKGNESQSEPLKKGSVSVPADGSVTTVTEGALSKDLENLEEYEFAEMRVYHEPIVCGEYGKYTEGESLDLLSKDGQINIRLIEYIDVDKCLEPQVLYVYLQKTQSLQVNYYDSTTQELIRDAGYTISIGHNPVPVATAEFVKNIPDGYEKSEKSIVTTKIQFEYETDLIGGCIGQITETITGFEKNTRYGRKDGKDYGSFDFQLSDGKIKVQAGYVNIADNYREVKSDLKVYLKHNTYNVKWNYKTNGVEGSVESALTLNTLNYGTPYVTSESSIVPDPSYTIADKVVVFKGWATKEQEQPGEILIKDFSEKTVTSDAEYWARYSAEDTKTAVKYFVYTGTDGSGTIDELTEQGAPHLKHPSENWTFMFNGSIKKTSGLYYSKCSAGKNEIVDLNDVTFMDSDQKVLNKNDGFDSLNTSLKKAGYKIVPIRIVNEKDGIHVDCAYVKDSTQERTLTYYVNFFKDGTEISGESTSKSATSWINTTQTAIQETIITSRSGLILQKIEKKVGDKVYELSEADVTAGTPVEDGAVINVYFITDTSGGNENSESGENNNSSNNNGDNTESGDSDGDETIDIPETNPPLADQPTTGDLVEIEEPDTPLSSAPNQDEADNQINIEDQQIPLADQAVTIDESPVPLASADSDSIAKTGDNIAGIVAAVAATELALLGLLIVFLRRRKKD